MQYAVAIRRPGQKRFRRGHITAFLLLFLAGFAADSFAQVNTYTFASSTAAYSPITGGTLHGSSDNLNYSFTLPFSFTYGGTGYTVARPTSNGFLVLGGNAPSASQYTPLSSGSTNMAIAALGWDLYSTVRSEVIGTAPNRVYVCQWSNAFRYSVTPTQNSSSEQINAQIRLYEGQTR
ncbi:hypothetical protein [uncultured Flavobacterium sp.]|uniref:hypothetical protein n=1 Tax=uncultured Flavobacterium sp. TaxID=165435 RepID=UPI0025E8C9B2|nr:hypothetical protein [uncultured Flavobacterium sp.]